jgi:ketosteroid isomerase-like protein
MSEVTEVLSANRAFYRAFAGRDMQAMESLWANEGPVACIHPGWDALRGREAILASWRGILANPAAPAVICRNETAHLLGHVAFVLCHEALDGAVLIATNIYVREKGRWRIALHHAGPLANPPEEAEPEPRRLQ